MNPKKPILIAVLINAALLAVLFVAALSTGDLREQQQVLVEKQIDLPKFDDLPLPIQELSTFEEPIVHNLPPLALELKPEPELPQAVPLPVMEPALFASEVIVKKGDRLEKIAKNHDTSISEIIKLNHLPNTTLKIGQVLKIPASRPSSKKIENANSTPEYYTIKVGENPWAIANKHHMKVQDLLKLNGLNEEKARKLKPGDRLRIR